jgi:hypothetical protein
MPLFNTHTLKANLISALKKDCSEKSYPNIIINLIINLMQADFKSRFICT